LDDDASPCTRRRRKKERRRKERERGRWKRGETNEVTLATGHLEEGLVMFCSGCD